jgi:hypothetical protein
VRDDSIEMDEICVEDAVDCYVSMGGGSGGGSGGGCFAPSTLIVMADGSFKEARHSWRSAVLSNGGECARVVGRMLQEAGWKTVVYRALSSRDLIAYLWMESGASLRTLLMRVLSAVILNCTISLWNLLLQL